MRWAVSHIDWIDHDLTTIIIEASNFWEAICKHPKVQNQQMEWLEDLRQLTPFEIKQQFFDCDSMIEAIPIPD